MKLHKLKTVQPHFSNVKYHDGKVENYFKKFEIRKNDRDFSVGDILLLQEYNSCQQEYTGDGYFTEINYILNDSQYLQPGFIVLGLASMVIDPKDNEDILNKNIDYNQFLWLNEQQSLDKLLEIMEWKNVGCFQKWDKWKQEGKIK
jgi:hypothetical protein